MMDRKCDTEIETDRSVMPGISIYYKIVLLFILGIFIAPAANAGDMKIFSNTNKNKVYNFKAPTFKIMRPMVITRIDTYHWNNKQGAPPGKIGIKGVGSWRAQGWPGMYNTPNANWTVRPNVRLEPGVYTIVDSDPATWSQNSGSRGTGFAEVFGRPVSSQPSTSSNGGSASSPINKTGNWIDNFIHGNRFNGKAFQGGRSWPFSIRITSFSSSSGELVGELTWKSLNSIHLIRGRLNGRTLTFTEVQAIKRGGAHLNVVYTMRLSNSNAQGTWVDRGDRSKGTVTIYGM